MVWISVLDDAICSIMQNPAGTRSAAESQKLRDEREQDQGGPEASRTNTPPSGPARGRRSARPA